MMPSMASPWWMMCAGFKCNKEAAAQQSAFPAELVAVGALKEGAN
jgi:hypothetical protein